MGSRCDRNTDVGLAKPFNELKDLPKFVVPALIQSVEENSNVDRLGALYEKLDDSVLTWSISTDLDVLINGFEIGPIFLRRPCDLLEKAACYVVGSLCFCLFQVEVIIQGDNVRSFQVFDSRGPILLESS